MKETKDFSLKDSLGYKLAMASRLARNRVNTLLKDLDIPLTAEQRRILVLLNDQDGKWQREIAEIVGIDEPSASRILNNLIREEYVIRKPDPSDHRKKRIFITKKGRDILPIVIAQTEKVDEESYKGFTDEEIVVLNQLLERITRNL